MASKHLYRLVFAYQDKIYEIYVRSICESELFGFVEAEEFVFDTQASMVVDPSEEKLKMEFKSVKKTYIPMHTILRIDEVEKRGVAKILDGKNSETKISYFPHHPESER